MTEGEQVYARAKQELSGYTPVLKALETNPSLLERYLDAVERLPPYRVENFVVADGTDWIAEGVEGTRVERITSVKYPFFRTHCL